MVSRLCIPNVQLRLALAAHRNSAHSRDFHCAFRNTSARARERERERAAYTSFTNFYTAYDPDTGHLQCTGLCPEALCSPQGHRSSLAPLPKASLILSISASTHLILSLLTGTAGALAAARDANAASAGICAEPYLCCCPGCSFDADDAGRVTDSVKGGCELCCRGWKCVWWMRSDDGFATWSIEE